MRNVKNTIINNKIQELEGKNRELSTMDKLKDEFLAIKKNFEPDKDLMIKPKHYTRFTSRPPHQNTFANYHAGEGSSIYISEKASVDLIISGTLEPDSRSEYHSGVSERRARQEAESV